MTAIRIGTRGSRLALAQAAEIKKNLERLHPKRRFKLVIIKTTGDEFQTVALFKKTNIGVFTKTLETKLLKKIFEKNEKAIKEGAGGEIVCEPWGKKWERIYKLLPVGEKELDEKMASYAAKEMKRFIETIHPFTKELLA